MSKTSKKIIEGRRLNYNASQQEKYIKALEKLVKRMTTYTQNQVIKLFSNNGPEKFYQKRKESVAMDASLASQARILTNELIAKFESLFSSVAKPLAEDMVKGAARESKTNLNASLKKLSGGLTLNTNLATTGLKEIVKATVTENVALIKSIATNYLSNVQKAVMRSITTGNGLEDLIPALEKQKGITKRHAKNVALDQTRKAYNAINKGRMEKVGIKKFKWVHSGGGQKPRQDHIDMSGNIYSFDDLPVIDKKTGERGIPGQAINCGCTMVPVIEFENQQ
jgi:SPP1 gp7 family putative phage head morphogenesis protein